MKDQKNYIKLIFLGILTMMLLNFPFLTLVGNKQLDGSISPIYIYVFVVWVIVIVMAIFVLRKKNKTNHE